MSFAVVVVVVFVGAEEEEREKQAALQRMQERAARKDAEFRRAQEEKRDRAARKESEYNRRAREESPPPPRRRGGDLPEFRSPQDRSSRAILRERTKSLSPLPKDNQNETTKDVVVDEGPPPVLEAPPEPGDVDSDSDDPEFPPGFEPKAAVESGVGPLDPRRRPKKG